jgi:very-short-patch-repair endonuclease
MGKGRGSDPESKGRATFYPTSDSVNVKNEADDHMTDLYNISSLKPRRQFLRNNCTIAESILWQKIRRRQICGVKFRRQYSVGCYILDFYCPEIRFSIELDGKYHDHPAQIEHDRIRTKILNDYGITELRIKNEEILYHLEESVILITKCVEEITTHRT